MFLPCSLLHVPFYVMWWKIDGLRSWLTKYCCLVAQFTPTNTRQLFLGGTFLLSRHLIAWQALNLCYVGLALHTRLWKLGHVLTERCSFDVDRRRYKSRDLNLAHYSAIYPLIIVPGVKQRWRPTHVITCNGIPTCWSLDIELWQGYSHLPIQFVTTDGCDRWQIPWVGICLPTMHPLLSLCVVDVTFEIPLCIHSLHWM